MARLLVALDHHAASLAALVLSVLAAPSSAQVPALVADLSPVSYPASSYAQNFAGGEVAYFAAETQEYGMELWRSDGTEAGTALVSDLAPTDSGYPSGITFIGSTLYFSAYDPVHGVELWRSDGTRDGAHLIADLLPGPEGSNPFLLHAIDSRLVFIASLDSFHDALWVSDGTAQGTQVLQAFPGRAGWMTSHAAAVYFVVSETPSDFALWRSDGTVEGTEKVVALGPLLSMNYLVSAGDKLYFEANDGVTGSEPWISDGTQQGTHMLRDMNSGADGSYPGLFTEVDGKLFFEIQYPQWSLWTSDGTDEGTRLVAPAHAMLLARSGDAVYFSVGEYGQESGSLWTTNLAGANAHAVRGFASAPRQLTDLHGTLLFSASDEVDTRHLWRSDGTPAGTALVSEVHPWPEYTDQSFCALGEVVLFAGDDGVHGLELWRSDGTNAGTMLVRDIDPKVDSADPAEFGSLDGVLYFAADDGRAGRELWRSDGTAADTRLVLDIVPGARPGDPRGMTGVNGTLLFSTEDALWRSDGTTEGTLVITPMEYPVTYPMPADDLLYFLSGCNLWRSDGTPAGTVNLTAFECYPEAGLPGSLNDKVYFGVTDGEHASLYTTDGTHAGTHTVADVAGRYAPSEITQVGDALMFRAGDSLEQLWESDGTAANTTFVKQFNVALGSPGELTSMNDVLYLRGDDGIHGAELWRSDGTTAGTWLVSDIYPGSEPGNPESLAVANGLLYFYADDGRSGVELWRSDGTSAGTWRVADINPGAGGAMPHVHSVPVPNVITRLGNTFFFAADDGQAGMELWQSDGTASGTHLTGDLLPGRDGSNPTLLTVVGGTLYFTADDGVTGRELWALRVDQDSDGVVDDDDNCSAVANADQRDTDGDGFGNACDADFDESCLVDDADLATLKLAFFGAAGGDTDLDGDGVTNFSDLALLKGGYLAPPGPSGRPNACTRTAQRSGMPGFMPPSHIRITTKPF